MIDPDFAFTLKFAQMEANLGGRSVAVWKHVGLYGQRSGDITARHVYIARRLDREDPPSVWAMVAIADPLSKHPRLIPELEEAA
jgi:hypothetical protein